MLGPRGFLLHKATSLSLGNITDPFIHRGGNTNKLGKMKRQRNMFQKRKQAKLQEKNLVKRR